MPRQRGCEIEGEIEVDGGSDRRRLGGHSVMRFRPMTSRRHVTRPRDRRGVCAPSATTFERGPRGGCSSASLTYTHTHTHTLTHTRPAFQRCFICPRKNWLRKRTGYDTLGFASRSNHSLVASIAIFDMKKSLVLTIESKIPIKPGKTQ